MLKESVKEVEPPQERLRKPGRGSGDVKQIRKKKRKRRTNAIRVRISVGLRESRRGK